MRLLILENDEKRANILKKKGERFYRETLVFSTAEEVQLYISRLAWNEGIVAAISICGAEEPAVFNSRIRLAKSIATAVSAPFGSVLIFYHDRPDKVQMRAITDSRPLLMHRLSDDRDVELGFIFKAAAENLDNLMNRKLDSLTGVFSRKEVQERLEVEFFLQKQRVSVLFIDIDDFKKINDKYGHLAGDEVLSVVAREIWSSLRPLDSIGRFGGEEFMAVVHCVSTVQLEKICSRILERVRAISVDWEGAVIRPTVTIGAALSGDYREGAVALDLIDKADDALYTGKFAGKNTYVIAP